MSSIAKVFTRLETLEFVICYSTISAYNYVPTFNTCTFIARSNVVKLKCSFPSSPKPLKPTKRLTSERKIKVFEVEVDL